jgi:hypothetical protein
MDATFQFDADLFFMRIRIFVKVMQICIASLKTHQGAVVSLYDSTVSLFSSLLFIFMRIQFRNVVMLMRIRLPRMIKIHADWDPQDWIKVTL